MTEASETNRDRVRRLLFEPLGFRHPKGMTEADGRAILNGIADELAYMAEDKLEALARMLRPHGQGSARNFWPDRATFVGFAHVCQPLPLRQDPKLVSWWASVEGQRMVQDGTLVETWLWFERHRIPPHTPPARARVAEDARENARRLQVIEERRALGYGIDAADQAWSRWYTDLRAQLTTLVDQARTAKGRVA